MNSKSIYISLGCSKHHLQSPKRCLVGIIHLMISTRINGDANGVKFQGLEALPASTQQASSNAYCPEDISGETQVWLLAKWWRPFAQTLELDIQMGPRLESPLPQPWSAASGSWWPLQKLADTSSVGKKGTWLDLLVKTMEHMLLR